MRRGRLVGDLLLCSMVINAWIIGVMYFWDLDGTTSEQFHRLKIITGNEEVEELPLISWIGPYAENALPMMATAGKGFSLKIWAPMKYSTVDDAVQVDGVEYGQGMRADSNGHQLLPSSVSLVPESLKSKAFLLSHILITASFIYRIRGWFK